MYLGLYRALTVAIVLWASCLLPSWASNATKEDVSALKDAVQLRMEHSKELLQKDLDAMTLRLEALNRRVDDVAARVGDVGGSVDRFTAVTGYIAIMIIVVLFGAGLVGYLSVKAQAKRDAQQSAQEWINANNLELQTQIAQLVIVVANAKSEIQTHTGEVAARRVTALATIDADLEQARYGLVDYKTAIERLGKSPAVLAFAEDLKGRPENSYSFEDWNARALATLGAADYEGAARFFAEAAKIPNAGTVNVAMALFRRGYSLSKLDRHEDALEAYGEVLDRYFDEASTNPDLEDVVATALLNTGNTLSLCFQRYDDAMSFFAKGLSMVEKSGSPHKQNHVALIKNGAGFTLLCRAKVAWSDIEQRSLFLNQAKRYLDEAFIFRPDLAILVGNLAYCSWLLADHQQAETAFARALTLGGGGSYLYEVTKRDLLISPVPEDSGFEELVVRLFESFLAQSDGSAKTVG